MSEGFLKIKFVMPEYFQCIIYALLMTLFYTVIQELWKRKENTIVKHLGRNPAHDFSMELNPDFSGFA